MTYRVWGFQLELQNLLFQNVDDNDDDDDDVLMMMIMMMGIGGWRA